MTTTTKTTTPKYRIAVSETEVSTLISYIENDLDNIHSNMELLNRLTKLRKKIAFDLLSPAYIAETPAQVSNLASGRNAFDKIRQDLNNGMQLTDGEKEFFTDYLCNNLRQLPETAAETSVVNETTLKLLGI